MEGESFSFVVIGDLHLGRSGEGRWHNKQLLDQSDKIAAIAVEMINNLSPRFVVVCGDITDLGNRKGFETARAILGRLKSPYHILTGNHDTGLPESRRIIFETFPGYLSENQIYKSFSHGEFIFITVDVHWQRNDGDFSGYRDKENGYSMRGIPPGQVEWLQEVLDSNADKHCFIFTHFPLVPMAAHLQGEGRKDAGRLENSDQLLELIKNYPNVCASFAGHQHFHQITQIDGVVHCINGAMIEYPMAFRQVVVFPDRFEIRYIPFRDHGYPQNSLIEDDWVTGRQEDREGIFPFRPIK